MFNLITSRYEVLHNWSASAKIKREKKSFLTLKAPVPTCPLKWVPGNKTVKMSSHTLVYLIAPESPHVWTRMSPTIFYIWSISTDLLKKNSMFQISCCYDFASPCGWIWVRAFHVDVELKVTGELIKEWCHQTESNRILSQLQLEHYIVLNFLELSEKEELKHASMLLAFLRLVPLLKSKYIPKWINRSGCRCSIKMDLHLKSDVTG